MLDITNLLDIIFRLLFMILAGFLIPMAQNKLTVSQQEKVNNWVKIAVTAAEQIYIGSGRGNEKKEYVINWLKQRNIKYDINKIDAMIEAAVYELKLNGIFLPEPSIDE